METPVTDEFAWLSRTELIVGRKNLERLKNSHVIVIGMGGVGSFAAEFICRAGVGEMTIVDGDTVDLSNCNRQLPALQSTVGQYKTEIMAERMRGINPNIKLNVITEFLSPEKMQEILSVRYDYLVDAIDSLTPKLQAISSCYFSGQPFVSSMGAGGKLDPTAIRVADISKTYNCPFAQMIRKRLTKYQIRKGFTTVFSSELPQRHSLMLTDGSRYKRSAYGTMSYIPAAFGCSCASVVIQGLIDMDDRTDGESL
jgi:tRNA A37 threonylcarbamoyladenosine dehydratase